ERRRLRVDYSVRQGRQCQSKQLQRHLDRLDRVGRRAADPRYRERRREAERLVQRQQRLDLPFQHQRRRLPVHGPAGYRQRGAGVPYASPAHNTWNGCTVDRGDRNAPDSGNYDTNVTTPTSSTPATLIAAEQYAFCPQHILPLGSPLVSSDWTNMTTLVNDMV